jgi:hypothetical protein
VEYAFDPERPRHLKRSEAGERASIVGSAMPNASVTAPLFSRHARPREGNRRSHHNGSSVESTRRAAKQRFGNDVSRNHYGRRESPGDGTLCYGV